MVGPYGAVTWWGFSPALDLQNECKEMHIFYTCFLFINFSKKGYNCFSVNLICR